MTDDTDKTTVGKTRRRLLTLLKRGGAQRADVLADSLGVTAMAARQHLYALRHAGLVDEIRGAVGRGRPPKLWTLTEDGHAWFPDRHRDIALDIVDAIRNRFGEDTMSVLLKARTDRQLPDYRTRLGAGPLRERVERLARLRTEEGYMAEMAEADDGSLLLIENHCPVCELARACSSLCAQEMTLFRRALGRDVVVERSEHIPAGARRCCYRIRPLSPASPASP